MMWDHQDSFSADWVSCSCSCEGVRNGESRASYSARESFTQGTVASVSTEGIRELRIVVEFGADEEGEDGLSLLAREPQLVVLVLQAFVREVEGGLNTRLFFVGEEGVISWFFVRAGTGVFGVEPRLSFFPRLGPSSCSGASFLTRLVFTVLLHSYH